MKEEQIQFLLEQKIATMNAIGGVTMSWWTTAIVFCLSAIGVVWLYRNKIERQFVTVGFAVVFVVFLLLAAYGVLVSGYLSKVQADLRTLSVKYGAPEATFDAEVGFFQRAMVTANIDFIVLTLVWIFLYVHMLRRPQPKQLSTDAHDEP
jgi:hypothetical protein